MQKGLCKIYLPLRPDAGADERPEPTNWANAVYLGIMYGSTIGGTCTIVGTGTNLVLQGLLMSLFPKAPELDFGSFMLYATPVMYIFMVFAWFWIQVLYMGMFRPNSQDAKEGDMGAEGNRQMNESIREKCTSMGRMSSHEAWVLTLFLVSILLWFFRKPGFIMGWSDLLHVKVKDSTVSFGIILLMFAIPMKWDWLDCFSCDKGTHGPDAILILYSTANVSTANALKFHREIPEENHTRPDNMEISQRQRALESDVLAWFWFCDVSGWQKKRTECMDLRTVGQFEIFAENGCYDVDVLVLSSVYRIFVECCYKQYCSTHTGWIVENHPRQSNVPDGSGWYMLFNGFKYARWNATKCHSETDR